MVGDIFRVIATFAGIQSSLRQWVWHYRQQTGGSIDEAAFVVAIIDMLTDAWDNLAAHIVDHVTGVDLQIQLWDPVEEEFNTVETGDITALVGDSTSAGAPGNAAPFVTFPTNVGRSTGKKFLFDVLAANVGDGLCTAALLADMALYAANFNDTIIEGGNTFRPTNFTPATGANRLWLQTTVGVGLVSGSQYRRLLGRGL